jgi:hypothetical protein
MPKRALSLDEIDAIKYYGHACKILLVCSVVFKRVIHTLFSAPLVPH